MSLSRAAHARVAVIDLGTNSVRFDVHQISTRGTLKLLHREKLMLRLGEGVFLKRKLDPRAVKRTLQAFSSFRRTAEDLGVTRYRAFATSALREATDAEELVRAIRNSTGIEVKIISGQEEAQMIATGILAHRPRPKGCFALVDIGGGSTEISICRDNRVVKSQSFPIGVARLQQVYLKTSPPSESAIEQLRHDVALLLRKTMKSQQWPRVDRVIGSSGTIRVIGRLLKKIRIQTEQRRRSASCERYDTHERN